MEKTKDPVCGFCHRSKDAEAVCGPLYVSSECAAHKKCMQYSALLVQYRTKGFGGFKKHKVVEEIKRGRTLPCSVCRSKTKKNKKPLKGATCGCAVSTCRRTYHYYCAHRDSTAICRRIEVLNKNTSKASVLYRVFCTPEHQQKFEKTQEAEMEINYNSDSSATEYTSDDEVYDEEDSPQGKKKQKIVKSKEAVKAPRAADITPPRSPSDTEVETRPGKKQTKGNTVTSTKRVNSGEESPSKRSRPEDGNGTEIFTDGPADFWEVDSSSQADDEIHIKEERLSSPKSSPMEHLAKPEASVVLCIMEEGKHLEKFGDRIRRMIAKQFNTSESAVCFWSSQGPHEVAPQHMLYFMRDVAKAVYDSNTEALTRLIVMPTQADIEKYNQHMQFHEDYMDTELRNHIQVRIRDVIGDYFLQKGKEVGVDVGGGFILAELNSIFLAMPLNDLVDPKKTIRQRLPGRDLVYPVDLSTSFIDPKRTEISESENQANLDKEMNVLSLWLQREGEQPLKIRVRPKEIILRQSTALSSTCRMCNHFQQRTNGDSAAPSSVVMFIVPVNGEVMAYGAYCKAAIGSFVKEELTPLNPIYCVLDVDDLGGFSMVSDILPPLPDNIAVQAFCGLDPDESPVSCVILKFYVE